MKHKFKTIFVSIVAVALLTTPCYAMTLDHDLVVNNIRYDDMATKDYLPLRFVADKLGATLQYHPSTRSYEIKFKGKVTRLTLDSTETSINGIPFQLVKPPIMKDGVTYIPSGILWNEMGVNSITYTDEVQELIDPDATNKEMDEDIDNDGLTYREECLYYKTRWETNDTDGDGINDGDEIKIYKTDPNKLDTDLDGLTDYEEVFIYKTDPFKHDSDGDYIGDIIEVCSGLNPWSKDSNRDGILDNAETIEMVEEQEITYNGKRMKVTIEQIALANRAKRIFNEFYIPEYEIGDGLTYDLYAPGFSLNVAEGWESIVVNVEMFDEQVPDNIVVYVDRLPFEGTDYEFSLLKSVKKQGNKFEITIPKDIGAQLSYQVLFIESQSGIQLKEILDMLEK